MDRLHAYNGGVRTLFISDAHLGWRHAGSERLLSFLKTVRPDTLYIVGDLIDGWALKKRWHWPKSADDVLRTILSLAKSGTQVRYTVGNHDEFLREAFWQDEIRSRVPIEIADEFTHVAANGETYTVLHGDRFDNFHASAPLCSRLSSGSYELLLRINVWWNRCTGQEGAATLSKRVKSRIRSLSRYLHTFENLLSDYARSRGSAGVICGHTHAPRLGLVDGVRYCNTGDWVENATAIIEDSEGRLMLIQDDGSLIDSFDPSAASAGRSQDERYRRIGEHAVNQV